MHSFDTALANTPIPKQKDRDTGKCCLKTCASSLELRALQQSSSNNSFLICFRFTAMQTKLLLQVAANCCYACECECDCDCECECDCCSNCVTVSVVKLSKQISADDRCIRWVYGYGTSPSQYRHRVIHIHQKTEPLWRQCKNNRKKTIQNSEDKAEWTETSFDCCCIVFWSWTQTVTNDSGWFSGLQRIPIQFYNLSNKFKWEIPNQRRHHLSNANEFNANRNKFVVLFPMGFPRKVKRPLNKCLLN